MRRAIKTRRLMNIRPKYTQPQPKIHGDIGSAAKERLPPLRITDTYAANTSPNPPVQVHANELNREMEAQGVK